LADNAGVCLGAVLVPAPKDHVVNLSGS
jgi:hypothetical protein